MEIINRKAEFQYHFLQTYEAGIILLGTEIKSLRKGNANLSDAYCVFDHGELYIKNMHIAEYELGTHSNHEPRRSRKLLLNKQELHKLERKVQEKGNTIVPYKIKFNERGFAKVEVVLAAGKKSYDKRDSIKEKDQKRELDRNMRIK